MTRKYLPGRWALLLLIALSGLALRVPQLSARPMHTDEAVNAYTVGQILAGAPYTYDPRDRHGPALFALALPIARASGAKTFADLTESELRATSVVAGTATLLLFLPAAEVFGFIPSLIGAVLVAFSSLPVYYDRYFIHESLFVAAGFALLLVAWQIWQTSSIRNGLLCGAFAGLMVTCKETALLNVLAIVGALLLGHLFNAQETRFHRINLLRPIVTCAATFLLITFTLYSWFGRNPHALSALLKALPDALARAGGQGHEKPALYFADLLTMTLPGKAIVTLASVRILRALVARDTPALTYLSLYFLILAVTYSLIPYKTPWLALNLWLPLALLAGSGADWLWSVSGRSLKPWPAFAALYLLAAAAVAVAIARDTRDRVFLHPSDEANPYAYAHTSDDLTAVPAAIARDARESTISNPRIAVIAADPWPLPWYLRRFPRTGFWQPGQAVPSANLYITSTEAAQQYAPQLEGLRPEFFQSRPGVLILLWSPPPK